MDTEGMTAEMMLAAKARAAKLRAKAGAVHERADEYRSEARQSEGNVVGATVGARAQHAADMAARVAEMRARADAEAAQARQHARGEVGFVIEEATGATSSLKNSVKEHANSLLGEHHYSDIDAEMHRAASHMFGHPGGRSPARAGAPKAPSAPKTPSAPQASRSVPRSNPFNGGSFDDPKRLPTMGTGFGGSSIPTMGFGKDVKKKAGKKKKSNDWKF